MCVLGTRICYMHGEIDQKKGLESKCRQVFITESRSGCTVPLGTCAVKALTGTSLVCGVRVREEHAAGAGCT